MVKLTSLATSLLIVAALALLFCLDLRFWNNIPLGYEGMLAIGGLAFWFGFSLSLLSVVLAALVFRRNRTRGRIGLLVCCVIILAGFAIVAAVDILYIT
jgi:hypothetical protein